MTPEQSGPSATPAGQPAAQDGKQDGKQDGGQGGDGAVDVDAQQVLERAASELYGATPAEFMPTRTRLVKEAKASGAKDTAKSIAALRKPSVAAWAFNHLARQEPDLLARLLELGEALRSAQLRLDASQLKSLRTQRESLLRELVTEAVRHAEAAGQKLSAVTRTELHDTAVAALASAEAAEAAGSGALTRALNYSGFGEVDLADAVAHTGTGVRLGVIRGGLADSVPATRRVAGTDGEDGDNGEGGETGDDSTAEDSARENEIRIGERRRAELTVSRLRRELDASSTRLDAARQASEEARARVASARQQLLDAEAEDATRLDELSLALGERRTAQQSLADAEAELSRLSGPSS